MMKKTLRTSGEKGTGTVAYLLRRAGALLVCASIVWASGCAGMTGDREEKQITWEPDLNQQPDVQVIDWKRFGSSSDRNEVNRNKEEQNENYEKMTASPVIVEQPGVEKKRNIPGDKDEFDWASLPYN